jgi:hypothetical protein
LILSDLMSMVEGATSGDTIETLKQKMTKSVEIYEQKLKEATAIAENTNSKTKIRVHLTDENGVPIPTCSELLFQPMAQSSNGPQVLQDSILLSHTTVASLKRKTNLKTEQPTASASAATTLPPSVSFNGYRKLSLKPRTVPIEEGSAPVAEIPAAAPAALVERPVAAAAPPSSASIFGAAKPVDTAARERAIEERLKEKQMKEREPPLRGRETDRQE